MTPIDGEKTKITCPRCGSPNVLPIMYGLPGQEAMEAALSGTIWLGGCCIDADMPMRHCGTCAFEWSGRE